MVHPLAERVLHLICLSDPSEVRPDDVFTELGHVLGRMHPDVLHEVGHDLLIVARVFRELEKPSLSDHLAHIVSNAAKRTAQRHGQIAGFSERSEPAGVALRHLHGSWTPKVPAQTVTGPTASTTGAPLAATLEQKWSELSEEKRQKLRALAESLSTDTEA